MKKIIIKVHNLIDFVAQEGKDRYEGVSYRWNRDD